MSQENDQECLNEWWDQVSKKERYFVHSICTVIVMIIGGLIAAIIAYTALWAGMQVNVTSFILFGSGVGFGLCLRIIGKMESKYKLHKIEKLGD